MRRIALRCDVGSAGRERLVRCLALAEELMSRGVEAVLVCDVDDDPWAQMQTAARGIDVVPTVETAEGYVDLLTRLGADAVVFDTGEVAEDVCAAVRRTGLPTVAVVDDSGREVSADVVVAPYAGAEEDRRRLPAGTRLLAGLEYALLRNDVLANRPISAPAHRDVDVPRVVVLDDASDDRAATAMARVLLATGRPFAATLVTTRPEERSRVGTMSPTAPGQRIEVAEPSWRLHAQVARADAVLACAGPTTHEWLCLGAAVALVWAAEEHLETYRRLMVRRAVVGVGSASALAAEPEDGAEKVARLLTDARDRARLGETAWRLVDGLGRARVADAVLELVQNS